MDKYLNIRLLLKSIVVCFMVLFMLTSHLQAARITDDDCAIGGVRAGWNSTHHYLPENFNKTGLSEVEWVKSKVNIPLDRYPQSYVVGFGGIPCERITLDDTIKLYGTYTQQSHDASANVLTKIFKKDPLYISYITIAYSSNMDRSFNLLATDLQTPRGIKLLSSADDVLRAYGNPDYITNYKNGKGKYYWYYTAKSLQIRKNNKGYLGACLIFSISDNDNLVKRIEVFNTYGYSK